MKSLIVSDCFILPIKISRTRILIDQLRNKNINQINSYNYIQSTRTKSKSKKNKIVFLFRKKNSLNNA